MKRLALVALTVFAAACSSGTPRISSTGFSSSGRQHAAARRQPPAAPRVLRRAEGRRDGQEPRASDVRHRELPDRGGPRRDGHNRRAGMGHHHVGVDTDCLPPGTVIPKAAPWVHFGTGATMMDPAAADARHAQAGAPDRRRHAHDDSRTLLDDHDHRRSVTSERRTRTARSVGRTLRSASSPSDTIEARSHRRSVHSRMALSRRSAQLCSSALFRPAFRVRPAE